MNCIFSFELFVKSKNRYIILAQPIKIEKNNKCQKMISFVPQSIKVLNLNVRFIADVIEVEYGIDLSH